MRLFSSNIKLSENSKPIIAAFVSAFIITVSLLWFMQLLITNENKSSDVAQTFHFVDFIRQAKLEKINTKKKKPPRPEQTPQLSKNILSVMSLPPLNVSTGSLATSDMLQDLKFSPRIVLLAQSEGDMLPIVKIAPIYPPRALNRGAEGKCIIEFTVNTDGSISDASEVPGQCDILFSAASLQAVKNFKYKPRVKNGVAYSVTGVRNKFVYRLDE